MIVEVGQPAEWGRAGTQVVATARGADGALRSAQPRASRRSIVLTALRAIPADGRWNGKLARLSSLWQVSGLGRFSVRRRGWDAPMHMLIHALVDASTEDEALTNGKHAFDRLVGLPHHSQAVFDYYTTFDETGSTVSGPARFGDIPVAARVETEAGQELVERGWNATKDEFETNLERVREGLAALSNEEIMEDVDCIQHAFQRVGARRGPSVFLYDEHGYGICSRSHLDRIVDDSDSLWIVPADVHY